MTSHCCLHLQCLFDRWHAMLDYLSWWTLWYKQIYLSGMRHSPGLLPFRENVKLFFFEKIWSKVGVWLIHECGLYTCEYGTYIHWATSSTITYYRSKNKLKLHMRDGSCLQISNKISTVLSSHIFSFTSSSNLW